MRAESSRSEIAMSALPPKADMVQRDRHVRFVPKADIGTSLVCQLLDHLVGAGEQRGRQALNSPAIRVLQHEHLF
jgi:hypothetical protein